MNAIIRINFFTLTKSGPLVRNGGRGTDPRTPTPAYALGVHVELTLFYRFPLWSQGIQCQLCHMTFHDQSAINAHYDVAHSRKTTRRAKPGEGTHECSVCDKTLSTKQWLRYHMATVHGVGDVKKFQCDICSRVFNTKGNLSYHIKNKHMKM